jgi:MFS family permease
VKQGLSANWKQFLLLVIVNAFVGGMIGMERTILPQLAEEKFGLEVKTAILSFIVVFGITKALANYYAGRFANAVGRKNLLTIGWLFALPVPFMLMWAPNWWWVIAANVLLGINQGLSWSSTVVMKIDLVGEKNRGLAMGLNESSGYLAVGGVALLTGWVAAQYGITPYPFYIGIALSVIGLLFSWLWIKDTGKHVQSETQTSNVKKLAHVFRDTSWRNPNLGAITQAGLVNNLNDGMIWGLLPIFLGLKNFSIQQIGVLAAIYPTVWGLGQLGTGKLADHIKSKTMLFWGMLLQGIVLLLLAFSGKYSTLIILMAILGFGTAVVYPTFLSAIASFTHPQQRAESIGVFRLWRDLGYAIGALLSGIIADVFGLEAAIISIGIVTLFSAAVISFRMD